MTGPTIDDFAEAQRILRASTLSLSYALDAITDAQQHLRAEQQAERDARDRLAEETVEVEWELRDRRVVKEGAKTWWVTDGTTTGRAVVKDDQIVVQVTAEEARDRLALEVKRHPKVRDAFEQVRMSEDVVAEARDRLHVAERRFSACKYDLSAATAELSALAAVLPLVHDKEHAR